MNSVKIFDEVILYLEKVIHDGGKIDYDNFCWCEVYTLKRFSEPSSRGESDGFIDAFI